MDRLIVTAYFGEDGMISRVKQHVVTWSRGWQKNAHSVKTLHFQLLLQQLFTRQIQQF
jgi:hypothetical protein